MLRPKSYCQIGCAVAWCLVAASWFLVTAGLIPQASSNDALLTVGGEVQPEVRLTASDLATFKRHKVEVRDHDQQVSSFEGVLLADILQKLGLPFGKQLRGSALTTYVLVEAADGYRVLFVLPELDSMFTDKVVLLADRRDGKPLSEREGPLRIVVPDEKRQARWIRQVKSIEVRNATDVPTRAKLP